MAHLPSKNKQLYSKNQVYLFDNLKALAILYIVFVHMDGSLASPLGFIALPFFAFASGYAFQYISLSAHVKQCVALYFFANSIFILPKLWHFWRGAVPESELLWALIGPNNIMLWYILALMVWGIAADVLRRFKYGFAVAIALVFLLPQLDLFSVPYNPQDPVGILKVTLRSANYWFLFFLAGNSVSWVAMIRPRLTRWRYSAGGILLLLAVLWYMDVSFVRQPDWFLYVALSFVATGAVLMVFPGKRIKYVTAIGRASLVIYILHPFFCYGLIGPVCMQLHAWMVQQAGGDMASFAPLLVNLLKASLIVSFAYLCSTKWVSTPFHQVLNYVILAMACITRKFLSDSRTEQVEYEK